MPAGAPERQTEVISRAIIGERVRIARVAVNLTQQELAGKTYSKSYISAVERGKMTPSFQALQMMAERLGRPVSFFLGEGDTSLQTSAGSGVSTLPDEERQQREQAARQMLVEAEACLVKSQAARALEVLQVEANAPPAALPLLERPRWYWLAGWAGVWAHQYAETILRMEQGLAVAEVARAQAPASQKARLAEMTERIRNFLGVCYYNQGQPAQALKQHARCLAAVTNGTVTDPELKLLIYKSMGNDTSVLGRHEEAIDFFKRACKLAEDMNEPRQRGLAYWGLGLVYKSSGDLFRAETAIREAVNIFERLDDVDLAARLHALLGQVLTRLNEIAKAEQHLRLALNAAERIESAYVRAVALGNLALLHMAKGAYDEAIAAAQEGIQSAQRINNHRGAGQMSQTLAEAYEARGDTAAAEQAYKEALATLMQTEDSEFIGRTHERYGQFLAAQGRFEQAYAQLDQAQRLLTRQTPG
ncbi:MAG TPA: tetratricopeptide repeat protein [Ktedonobacterales bacterium]|jgi:tetratricopeptide (TPR) repeat protein/DNA-binding XRE family transcriptional regulator